MKEDFLFLSFRFLFFFSSVSRERREILCVGEKSDRILVGG